MFCKTDSKMAHQRRKEQLSRSLIDFGHSRPSSGFVNTPPGFIELSLHGISLPSTG